LGDLRGLLLRLRFGSQAAHDGALAIAVFLSLQAVVGARETNVSFRNPGGL
jgi:hypothetical protein